RPGSARGAGSRTPEAASSSTTELRRTRVTSRAARAASSRVCIRSRRPARQDTYTPRNAAIATMMTMSVMVMAFLGGDRDGVGAQDDGLVHVDHVLGHHAP